MTIGMKAEGGERWGSSRRFADHFMAKPGRGCHGVNTLALIGIAGKEKPAVAGRVSFWS